MGRSVDLSRPQPTAKLNNPLWHGTWHQQTNDETKPCSRMISIHKTLIKTKLKRFRFRLTEYGFKCCFNNSVTTNQ